MPRADLADAVSRCRASGQAAQALDYRRAKGMSTDRIEMGVLIQRMIHPVTAGVAFSVNPVTGATGELVINASWGLGEALVNGQVDPDEFVVRKADGELLWTRLGDKGGDGQHSASLTVDQVRAIARLLIDIERHYGAPQDIEWCHDGTDLWVVQSRPITSAGIQADETEWTRANIGEVLPDVTSPQVLAAFEDLLNQAERKFVGGLMAPESELGPMVKSFCGRLYFNLSQLRRVCAVGGVAAADMLRSMGHAGAIQPSDEVTPRPTLSQLRLLPDMLRILRRHQRAGHIVGEHQVKTQELLDRLSPDRPQRLSDADLWSVIEQWSAEAPDYMQTVLLFGNVLFREAPVKKVCDRVGFPFEQLVYPQLALGERSVSAQQAFDLVALAEVARHEPRVVAYLSEDQPATSHMRVVLRGTAFLEAFEQFLEKYGHRGLHEYDWSLPRYHEDPTPLLRAIRGHLEAGPATRAGASVTGQQRAAADAMAAFERRLSTWQRWTTLRRVRGSVRKIKQYYVWREQVRSDLARVIGALRVWYLTLAERFVERGWLDRPGDFFLLHLEEVASVVRGTRQPAMLHDIVAARRAELERNREDPDAVPDAGIRTAAVDPRGARQRRTGRREHVERSAGERRVCRGRGRGGP